jgi:hypothetical protein
LYGLIRAWWGSIAATPGRGGAGWTLFAELWIWPDYNGYYQGPLSVWVCEVIVGLAVLVWVGMPRRRIRLRDKIASPGSNPAGRMVMGWRPTLRPP